MLTQITEEQFMNEPKIIEFSLVSMLNKSQQNKVFIVSDKFVLFLIDIQAKKNCLESE